MNRDTLTRQGDAKLNTKHATQRTARVKQDVSERGDRNAELRQHGETDALRKSDARDSTQEEEH